MIKLTTVQNMRLADEKTIEGGISAIELMRRAAEGVYGLSPVTGKLAVVCGYGNNGGDGFALAEILQTRGHNVTVFCFGEPKTEAARYYFFKIKNLGVNIFYKDKEPHLKLDLSDFDVIFDCLLGTGARFLGESPILTAVSAINSSGAYVVSCDINSGLDGDSGLVNGLDAVKSDLTVSIGAVKTGLLLHSAADYIKEWQNVDIGIEQQSNIFALETSDLALAFPKRLSHTNKGNYGKCGILGGSIEYSGAVKLANLAESALRCGVGLCSLVLEPDVAPLVAPYLLESTVRLIDKRGEGYSYSTLNKAISDLNCLLVGVGWGQNPYNLPILKYILENFKGVLVLDADGLNTLSGEVGVLASAKCKVVLTPHIKEMERLSGKSVPDIKKSAIETAESFAKRYNVTVVLKDNSTIIAGEDKIYISTSGAPSMAKGGSGDVLAGAICGKLAQKEGNEDLTVAVAAVTYLVGKAGEAACREKGAYSALPSDTVSFLGAELKKLID